MRDFREDDSGAAASAARTLWLAVLAQAVADGDAGFLRITNPHFIRICSLAGVDPRYFLRKVHVAPAVVNEASRERARERQKRYNANYRERLKRERVPA